MTKEIKKLENILINNEPCENKRAVILVYLSVVLLQKKFTEVAKYFGLSESKVLYSVSTLHIHLHKNKVFHQKIKSVLKDYFEGNQLKLVA